MEGKGIREEEDGKCIQKEIGYQVYGKETCRRGRSEGERRGRKEEEDGERKTERSERKKKKTRKRIRGEDRGWSEVAKLSIVEDVQLWYRIVRCGVAWFV
jgi:hypothetical protein